MSLENTTNCAEAPRERLRMSEHTLDRIWGPISFGTIMFISQKILMHPVEQWKCGGRCIWKYLHKLMNRNKKDNTLLLFYFCGMCQLSSFVNPYGGTLMFFCLPVSITIKKGAEFRGDRRLRRSLNACLPVGPHHTACKHHPFGFLAIRKQPC